MSAIPTDMQPFFHKTPPTQTRAAIVQHVVSDIITRKIFEPFLFVLSGPVRATDQLFEEMSKSLKSKSTRRETLWRQQTLRAAYTASGAKRSINEAAHRIVDEITDTLKGYANKARWKGINLAVRNIVKCAVETWRYARLEPSLIVASMNTAEMAKFQHHDSTEKRDFGQPPSLSLFPVIRREAKHDSLLEENESEDRGCIYSSGQLCPADDPNAPQNMTDSPPPPIHQHSFTKSSSSHSPDVKSVRDSSEHSPLMSSITGSTKPPQTTRPVRCLSASVLVTAKEALAVSAQQSHQPLPLRKRRRT